MYWSFWVYLKDLQKKNLDKQLVESNEGPLRLSNGNCNAAAQEHCSNAYLDLDILLEEQILCRCRPEFL